jgi:DNA polymerase III epsilon subunit-like protein
MDGSLRVAYVAVDVESTGFQPGRDYIYEVAVVSYADDGRELDCYQSVCRPGGDELSPRLRSLAAAPRFAEIAGDVVARLRLAPVIGHNVGFDLDMINAELERFGAGLPDVPAIDTLDLVRGLRIDTPDRELATVCQVVGVTGTDLHTAAGDARAAAELFFALRRQVLEAPAHGAAVLEPRWFHGGAAHWPDLERGTTPVRRNLTALPPAPRPVDPDRFTRGQQPEVDVLSPALRRPDLQEKVARLRVALTRRRIDDAGGPEALPPEMGVLLPTLDGLDLAAAVEAASAISDWLDDPTGELGPARRDLRAGHFTGPAGIARLQTIRDVFVRSGEEVRYEVTLKLARLKRYDPAYDLVAVGDAYRAAFDLALEEDDELGVDEEDEDARAADVLDEWVGYLQDVGTIDDVLTVMRQFPEPRWGWAHWPLAGCVHRLRTADRLDEAGAAARAAADYCAESGYADSGADVMAEWAQALEADHHPDEAVAVCEQAWDRGWANEALANRHSLILERMKRYGDAVAICDRWLESSPGSAQIAKRRQRCARRRGHQ